MASKHTHDMAKTVVAGIYKCRSCEFRCTERALPLVRSLVGKHIRVKRTDPNALVPWDQQVGRR